MLDPKTLMMITMLDTVALSAMLGNSSSRISDEGASAWVRGAWMQALSWCCFISGYALNAEYLLSCGVAAISASFSFAFLALRRFNRQSSPKLLVWLPPACAFVIHAFGVFLGNKYIRISIADATVACQTAPILWQLLQQQRARGGWRWFMFSAMGCTFTIATVRLIALFTEGGLQSFESTAPLNVATLSIAAVVVNVNTLAFVLAQRDLAHQALHKLASTDPLTGLLNRRSFMAAKEADVALAQQHGHEMVAVMLDIDHFKTINDTYGHSEGDEVLKEFSKILRDVVRLPDLVSRMGGEEFCLLLPKSNLAAAAAIDKRLRDSVSRSAILRKFAMNYSAGAADLKPHYATLDELLKDADAALYKAKNNGRGRLEYAA